MANGPSLRFRLNGLSPKPHVVKVYRNSWITEIEWGERYPEGLGTFDMRKLSNPGRD